MINKAILIGRLGEDPTLRYTPSGAAVCNFSMATSESYTDKQGSKQEKTEWHRVNIWGKQAETTNQYLSKGQLVYIEGKIETRSYEKDGDKRYVTEIKAIKVQFLDRKVSTQGGDQNNQSEEYNVNTNNNFATDDIPF